MNSNPVINTDELAEKYFSQEVNKKFASVDVVTSTDATSSRAISLDELSREILPLAVNQAMPEVDLEIKEFSVELEIEKFRFVVRGRDISITLFILALAILIASWIS